MKNNQVAESFLQKANECLATKKYNEALENFNQCLRLAVSNSKVLSDAYAGRSKVYYEAQLFEKCLENIQCAIDASVFEDKCKVFEQFQEKCTERMKEIASDCENDTWSFFKLSKPAHNKIPFIANCLEVRENDVYGRYIMTTSDLKTGDIVVVEEPFYKVFETSKRHMRCAICLRQNMLNLFPCANCSDGESVNDFGADKIIKY